MATSIGEMNLTEVYAELAAKPDEATKTALMKRLGEINPEMLTVGD